MCTCPIETSSNVLGIVYFNEFSFWTIDNGMYSTQYKAINVLVSCVIFVDKRIQVNEIIKLHLMLWKKNEMFVQTQKKVFKLHSQFTSIIIYVELGRLIKVHSKNVLFFMHFATRILYYHAIMTCIRVGWKLKKDL